MCRIFGFRSIIQSQVHQSLVGADNALVKQSENNPDGWGVAYYIADAPHVVKSVSTAIDDQLFRRVSGVVSSETVVAHIRRGTAGENSILNTHPFQHGRWVFAHNGNIKNFPTLKAELLAKVSPSLRRFVLGETDSEVIFFLFLSHISRRVELHRHAVSAEDVMDAAADALLEIRSLVGSFHTDDNGPPDETYLTFLLTNGTTMIGHQGGKNLHYSTYKSKCSAKKSCPHFEKSCENPTENGYINHLVFSSEPLRGENIWIGLENGQILGVDASMQLRTKKIPA